MRADTLGAFGLSENPGKVSVNVWLHRTGLIVAALICVATGALGQSGPEGGVVFELNYSNPGARSLALGGAFAALADDATAAFANPAGLVQLVDFEVSMEGRYRGFSTPYTRNGRIDGTTTGIGLDTAPDLVYGRTSENLAELSFLSVVYPKGRWAVALYRHNLVNFEFDAGTQGLFGEEGSCCGQRFADQTTRSMFDIVGYGLSGAWRVHDKFSMGIGVVLFDGSVIGDSAIYAPQADDPWGANRYLPQNRISSYDVGGSSTSWGISGGILWSPREWLHLGAFYRQAPKVEMTVALQHPQNPLEFDAELELPAVYGVGVAYRSGDGRVAASLEWDRVEYSTMTESIGFTEVVLDDGDELHAGLEYLFIDSSLLWSIRAGAWLDPDHRTRYVLGDPFERALHPPGSDELHYSLGVGVVFEPFQFDFAFDVSDPVNTVSLSAIYSF